LAPKKMRFTDPVPAYWGAHSFSTLALLSAAR
jgi:hypothetical protein